MAAVMVAVQSGTLAAVQGDIQVMGVVLHGMSRRPMAGRDQVAVVGRAVQLIKIIMQVAVPRE
jgi:hypothetical protein